MKLEIGYAFQSNLTEDSLKRLSKISTGLNELIKSSKDKPFIVEVGLTQRINTGLFEYMHFASHSEIKWKQSSSEGYFLPENSTQTSFSALLTKFSKNHIFNNPDEIIEEKILEEVKYLTKKIGLPDFYTGGYSSRKNIAKKYALFIIPLIEETGARLADFHNEYDAIVNPKQRNSERHLEWIKKQLTL